MSFISDQRPTFTASRSRTGLALVAAISATAATAQEAGRTGSEFYLDLVTGAVGNDNYYSIEEPTGNSFYWNNDFELGYSSQTKGSSFAFATGGVLNIGSFANSPDNENYDFKDPFVELAYGKESKDAKLGLTARYDQTDNSFRVNSDEDLTSSDLIIDSGTRDQLSLGADLELGRNGPINFIGGLGYIQNRYHDTTNSNLSNNDRTDIGVQFSFELSQTLALLVLANYYDQDNISDTKPDWTTTSAGIGLEGYVNPTLSFRTTLSYGRNETTETVSGERKTTTIERPVFEFQLQEARPNGAITASFNSRLETTGLINTLLFGRRFETRAGVLAFALGATSTENGDIFPGGNVDWLREFKRSQVNMTFKQSIRVNDEDEEVLNSSLRFGYRQEVTNASGFNVALNLAASEGLSGDTNDYQQAGLTVDYFHDLTEDWQLITGYRHNYSNDNDKLTTENVVFATFGRRFSFRP
ncbi:hypothetical protein [Tropicimonas sp. IMCC34043]|uniref:hypothetical protein n=1 Tax=Tropicimonas sp. IMCC34043 TaxID=2248760 RepID=UPI0013001797|nr:hypothetical protein [Tropicimonas sp. IMCC34043]